MNYITKAFQSPVELTPEQENIAFSNAGVRKFGYNDLLYRKEYYYALDMLNGKRPIAGIFSIKNIARILNIKWEYPKPFDVVRLTDKNGDVFELRKDIHGKYKAPNGKEHPKPEAAFAWLQERITHLIAAPLDPSAKDAEERARFEWIAETDSRVYREAKTDLKDAFKRFFDPKIKSGYPKYDKGDVNRLRVEPGGAKAVGIMYPVETEAGALVRLGGDYVQGAFIRGGKIANHDGVPTVYKNVLIQVERDKIKLPIFGWVKLSRKGYIPTSRCKYISFSLKRKAGKWHLSLTVSHLEVPDPKPRKDTTLGFDMGQRHLMVNSTGKTHGKYRDLDKEAKLERKIARLNRAMIRRRGKIKITPTGAVERDTSGKKIKQEPSKRYLQTRLEWQKAQEKLSNMRNDLRHKATRRAVNYGAEINRMENISVQDMMRKLPTGTSHEKRLRKINAKVGYGEIRRQMEYKSKWAGATLEADKRTHYTSKQCSACGTVNHMLRSNELFKCIATPCGFGVAWGTGTPPGADLPLNHRDFNAAMTHADPERHRAARDFAWAARHPGKEIPEGIGESAEGKPEAKGKRGAVKKTAFQKRKPSSDGIAVSCFATSKEDGAMIASNAHQNRQAKQNEIASSEVMCNIAHNDFEQLQVERGASAGTARKPLCNDAESLVSGETGRNA